MKLNIGRFLCTFYEEKNCWELIQWVYRDEFGIKLPAVEHAVDLVESGEMFPVEQGEEQVGDILVFRDGIMKTHVAIVTDPKMGLMFHTLEGINACEVRYRDSLWKNRLKSIYRHRDMLSGDPTRSP